MWIHDGRHGRRNRWHAYNSCWCGGCCFYAAIVLVAARETLHSERGCRFLHNNPLWSWAINAQLLTVYPKKYAHGFCFAVLCCGYTLTDFPISIRLTSLALWQSNDCPSARKATLMNMDKYFTWIHYARLHNHNKAKHNKTMCIFLGIYCTLVVNSRYLHVDGFVRERRNSIANTLELRLSCTNPSMFQRQFHNPQEIGGWHGEGQYMGIIQGNGVGRRTMWLMFMQAVVVEY